MRIPFAEWLPDQPALTNPGALLVKNCIPFGKSYGQLRSLQSFTDALASACVGAYWLRGSDDLIYTFAGTSSKLYLLGSDSSWDDVSKVGGYTGSENWEFAPFGDRIIAVSAASVPQYFDVGDSSAFADLPGSPPIARRIGIIGDFVVLGDLVESSINHPNRIRWGGFNSTELWTASVATQSDKQDLYGRGGRVQRIIPGSIVGYILQENSFRRMEYVGPPLIFDIKELETETGTPVGNSACWTRGACFYLGHDGFAMFDGQRSVPIGAEKIDRWFRNNSAALDSMRAVVDRKNRLVMWAYKSNSSAEVNDRLLIYSWPNERWTHAEINTEVLVTLASPSVTLEGLDAIFPSGIDAQELSVDTDVFRGGQLQTVAFGSDHKAASFNGNPLDATIQTAEFSDEEGKVTHLRRVRPLIDGRNATIRVYDGTRMTMQDEPSWSPAVHVSYIGEASFRVKARYHRLQVEILDGFEHAIGIETDEAGLRVCGRK